MDSINKYHSVLFNSIYKSNENTRFNLELFVSIHNFGSIIKSSFEFCYLKYFQIIKSELKINPNKSKGNSFSSYHH